MARRSRYHTHDPIHRVFDRCPCPARLAKRALRWLEAVPGPPRVVPHLAAQRAAARRRSCLLGHLGVLCAPVPCFKIVR